MRTVQEIIKSLNTCKLVATYLDEHESVPITDKDLNWIDKENDSYKTFISTLIYHHKRIKRLFDYIERVKNLTVEESNDMIIAYATNDFYDKLSTSYIQYNDIDKPAEQIETYSYEFSSHSEIFGWKLPETKFVKENIYQVIADILFEASFFGYEQEELEGAKQQLKDALDEIKNKMDNNTLRTFEDFKRTYQIEDDPEELTQLKNALVCAENQYLSYLKKRELEEIKQLLKEGK